MRYLLDANVISEPLRKRASGPILRRLTEEGHLCALCAPVWHEISFGLAREPRPDRRRYLEVLRASAKVLPYDQRAAEWHAEERARLEREGKVPSFVDGMIASVAATNGLVVVTRNVKHFEAFRGVDVQRW